MTVEELLEIEEIKQLRVLYSHYLDGGDLDGLVSLFCEDAVCEFGEKYGGNWVGRETIRQNYAPYTTGDIAPFTFFMHAVTNPWIQLTGPETAHGRWYLLDLNLLPGNDNPLNLFGIYDDRYRKVDGKWLIQNTRIEFLWSRPGLYGPGDSD